MLNYYESPSTHSGIANTLLLNQPDCLLCNAYVMEIFDLGVKWNQLYLRRDVSESNRGWGPQNIGTHSQDYVFIQNIVTKDLIVQC